MDKHKSATYTIKMGKGCTRVFYGRSIKSIMSFKCAYILKHSDARTEKGIVVYLYTIRVHVILVYMYPVHIYSTTNIQNIPFLNHTSLMHMFITATLIS